MKKQNFNENWTYRILGEKGAGRTITLPHDALITEPRSMKAAGIHNIGWFESHDYEYEKIFELDPEYESFILEFEGVYHGAEVFLDGERIAQRAYGYTNFFIPVTDRVKQAGTEREQHVLKVVAHNSDQPNSRWYSGAGLYRPVWLYAGASSYILPDTVRISTIKLKEDGSAVIRISAQTSSPGHIHGIIRRQSGEAAATVDFITDQSMKTQSNLPGSAFGGEDIVTIPDAKLWSPQAPLLYNCTLEFTASEDGSSDLQETSFGIRTLDWSAQDGLEINGQRIILKGACIHHDNGILGACAFPEAEERKIRLLMDQGYNAIRSAHNPVSKAMLDVCDRLGMLILDEYADMWYIHKNKYDYASVMKEQWHDDLREMVNKDFNHPSVILYSTGNEVAETGEKEGIALTGQLTEYLHTLDDTRPVTCGINIFFNYLYSIGLGFYSDEKAEKEAAGAVGGNAGKRKTVGSEFYNTMAGILGDKIMKFGATLPACDRKTKGAYARMDIAGYNYGIDRYKHDLKKYPERLILGSETFCCDAYRFYELAKREPRIIGDFVWAGQDYIGEAGIGAWEYEDYAPKNAAKCGWLTAGSGRIDILGFTTGEALYTRVALEEETGPFLAVRPVYQKGSHSPSAWKMTDAMPSWTWPGCEGEPAQIEVYVRAERAALFLNGKKQGERRLRNNCIARFKVPYQSGELSVLAYDAAGNVIGSNSLQTAEPTQAKLKICWEAISLNDQVYRSSDTHSSVRPGSLIYFPMEYTDSNGI